MPDEVQSDERTRVFPMRWTVRPNDDRSARILELTDEGATEVFESLSSETARALLAHLHDDPQTASDLADRLDTSLQNVQYHLQKFQNAELVDVVDTWYSARGTEMKVYSPTHHSLVLYTGTAPGETGLDDMLARLVGAIAILAIGSVAFDWIVRTLGRRHVDRGGGSPPLSPDPPLLEIAGMAISPGVVFFVGGLFVVALGVGWWYWRQ
ncbi:ArsR/SmtB family transcription factor [Haladaptatus sp. NG-SE-30]